MQLLKRYKKEIIALVFLFALYFVLRTIYLTSLPIFTDEAIYLRWAQIALHDSNWRFISLTDGKQPLFVWTAMIFQKFITDPLLAGRLVSVFSGAFTLAGLLLLSYELFKNKSISFLTGLVYIVYPFAQVYDRMALMEGMVGAFTVWTLLFGIYLVKKVRLDIAYTLGFILGGSLLTKSSGAVGAYLLPFTLLIFDFKTKNSKHRLFRWIIFAGAAFAIGQAMYLILRLSPFFYIIAQKNDIFIYTFQEWIHHPFQFFLSNAMVLLGWWFVYFNVFILLVIAGFLNRKFIKENLLLLAYFIIPFLVFGVFAKTMYPRYLYPMTLSLLPICGLGLYFLINKASVILKNNKLPWILVPIFIAYPLFVSVTFATNPNNAPIADADQNQYIKMWPAGWGVKESVEFLGNQAQSQKIFVGTEGTFGLMPFSLELYLVNNPNITLKSYWPIKDSPPIEVEKASKTMPTYVLFYQPCPSCLANYAPPPGWRVNKVLQAPRGNLAIYQILP